MKLVHCRTNSLFDVFAFGLSTGFTATKLFSTIPAFAYRTKTISSSITALQVKQWIILHHFASHMDHIASQQVASRKQLKLMKINESNIHDSVCVWGRIQSQQMFESMLP